MVADKFPNGPIGLIGLNPSGPIGPNRHSRPCTLFSTTQFVVRRVADVAYRKRSILGIVLKRTARGCLLFGIGRRCALITTN